MLFKISLKRKNKNKNNKSSNREIKSIVLIYCSANILELDKHANNLAHNAIGLQIEFACLLHVVECECVRVMGG